MKKSLLSNLLIVVCAFANAQNVGINADGSLPTGTYNYKAFSETGRYTSTWIFKDGKWQMDTDHTSVIPDKSTANK